MARTAGRARAFPARALLLTAAVLVVLAGAACEKPDASDTTSPSALALIGTATGTAAYGASDAPPADVAPPAGWEFELGNARYSKLENGERSIQVVTQVKSRPGPELAFWLSGPEGTVLHWNGGSARAYDGVFCFQLRLENDREALSLAEGPYRFTMAFVDPATAEVVTARTVTVAGVAHASTKVAPGAGSDIGRELLGCPRSVI
ncbi:MAG: hypothetical protein IT302_10855 [Dehalococcoidia bacterium]|nr:hypothetical protein [Dehalococcoidia bacterium]